MVDSGVNGRAFKATKQNVSLHINNVFKEKELDPSATVKEYLTVRYEGIRQVKRKVKLYNLDVIISVGYRVQDHLFESDFDRFLKQIEEKNK